MADLLERLARGPVICAEGYLFELERRGYLQAGGFVPEVVLEHPEKVAELHREFVHAGSDVVEAFTYYAHREKLRVIGREDDLERINRRALEIAKEVSAESDALLAGNICNTNVWAGDESRDSVRDDVRGAGRVGGRGGCRLRHRRDVLLARRSAAGHCSHQGGGTPRRGDADRAPPRQRARGDLAGRGVQAARGRRRRRGRAELRARAGNDAAVARGGAPGGHRPRGGPAGPLSHDGEPPDLPLARGSRGTGPGDRGEAVSDRARSVHLLAL